jgi:hypothetical protein
LKEPVRISGSHLFPTLILDRLVNLLEILNTPKSVQEHLDYDQVGLVLYLLFKNFVTKVIK